MTINFEAIERDTIKEKIDDGITRYITWYNNSCCYKIESSKKTVMIDASYPLSVDERIDILALTHGHCDHPTYAQEIVMMHPGCEVYASRGTAEWLKTYGNEIIPEHRTDVKELLAKYKTPPIVYPVSITKIIREGDVIDTGSSTLRVITVSGHSPEHTCFLEEERGMFFTGDAWFGGNKSGGWTSCGEPIRGSDRKLLEEAIKKLQSVKGVRMLCPGHML